MTDLSRVLFEAEDWRNLPPEDVLDVADPRNDPYFQTLENLQALAVLQADKMRPRHVQVVKMHLTGKTNAEIASRLRYSPTTVSTILHREDARALLHALRHVENVRSGPSIEQRKNMLTRIARRAERPDPTTAIAAVRELNKMDGAYTPVLPPPPPAVSITINQEAFPKTALDGQIQPALSAPTGDDRSPPSLPPSDEEKTP